MDEKTPLCPHGLPCGKGCEACTTECEKDRTAFAQELGPLASYASLCARMDEDTLCLGEAGYISREDHDANFGAET